MHIQHVPNGHAMNEHLRSRCDTSHRAWKIRNQLDATAVRGILGGVPIGKQREQVIGGTLGRQGGGFGPVVRGGRVERDTPQQQCLDGFELDLHPGPAEVHR